MCWLTFRALALRQSKEGVEHWQYKVKSLQKNNIKIKIIKIEIKIEIEIEIKIKIKIRTHGFEICQII